MSLTLKLASLAIRTLAKPVANRIKYSAREHEGFRKTFIRFAQGLHKVDMRMRLGILHDSAAQERMHAREAADQAKKKAEAEIPKVRTEAEQKKFDEEQQAKAEGKDPGQEQKEEKKPKPKIRPLSESRAIELGANFVSEAFIFGVAVGVIFFERWWSRQKDAAKDEHVVERIAALEEQAEKVGKLEREILRLRGQNVEEPPPKTKETLQEKPVSSDKEKQQQVVAAS
ncbi:optic atrophy 3-like protein [Elsinoe ampelina]|uniref:Optic atrophy 3-like protein n=1 Tax=Elsinoe ampelina TaxID=302913 RepID=A0A6A6G9F6_9PEZI|nr:optic atrophy 3-like protein [Elsinoe ampelina]